MVLGCCSKRRVSIGEDNANPKLDPCLEGSMGVCLAWQLEWEEERVRGRLAFHVPIRYGSNPVDRPLRGLPVAVTGNSAIVTKAAAVGIASPISLPC